MESNQKWRILQGVLVDIYKEPVRSWIQNQKNFQAQFSQVDDQRLFFERRRKQISLFIEIVMDNSRHRYDNESKWFLVLLLWIGVFRKYTSFLRFLM